MRRRTAATVVTALVVGAAALLAAPAGALDNDIQVGIGQSASAAAVGSPIRLTGAIRTPALSRRLILQRSADGQQWSNYRSSQTDELGNTALTVGIARTTYFRWWLPDDAQVPSTTSSPVEISLLPILVGIGAPSASDGSGTPVRLVGALRRPAIAKRLELQASTDGRTFHNILAPVTDQRGNTVAYPRPTTTTYYRWWLPGDATVPSTTSAVRQVVVPQVIVGVGASPNSVQAGQPLTLVGAIRRPALSKRLYLQSAEDGRTFRNLQAARTDSRGNVRLILHPRATTTYRWWLPGDSQVPSTTSGVVRPLVTSAPPPPPPAGPPPRSYPNCAELNDAYPHGVGRPGAHDHVPAGDDPVTNFTVDATVYALNTARDRDDDGIACEKH